MTKQTWLSRLSATAQLIIGFIFGTALIAGVVGSAGYLYFRQMAVRPEKPIFFEETAEGQKELKKDKPPLETSSNDEVAPEPKPEPKSEPKPEPAEPELPPNAYKAKVTWPQGLSLRSEPGVDAERIGGIGYDAEIIVLEESADNNWQRVLLPWSEQEGWVKNGNTERVAY